MTKRALRNWFLISLAGALWVVGVVVYPLAHWAGRDVDSSKWQARHDISATILQWQYPPPAKVCGTGLLSLWAEADRLRPPQRWREFSFALLCPGLLALSCGLAGVTHGCFSTTSPGGFAPSRGNRN
jgi:hypothetical protein